MSEANNNNNINPDELDRLARKLNYHESSISKLLANAHTNTKIAIVKEKIEQFEQMVQLIPDCCGTMFEEWMDTVVQLWEKYSAAASAAGHRHVGGSANAVSYPQPITSTSPAATAAAGASGSLNNSPSLSSSIPMGSFEKHHHLHHHYQQQQQQQRSAFGARGTVSSSSLSSNGNHHLHHYQQAGGCINNNHHQSKHHNHHKSSTRPSRPNGGDVARFH